MTSPPIYSIFLCPSCAGKYVNVYICLCVCVCPDSIEPDMTDGYVTQSSVSPSLYLSSHPHITAYPKKHERNIKHTETGCNINLVQTISMRFLAHVNAYCRTTKLHSGHLSPSVFLFRPLTFAADIAPHPSL